MPRIVLRVVCSTGLTIVTFSPTIRLTSVDFPALVRPTTPTIAALRGLSSFLSAIRDGDILP